MSQYQPWEEEEYVKYTLWFVFACIIYSIIGFSWGALMGGIHDFRHFVDHRMFGKLIVRA
ncbi:MAG: cytochrome oxidase, partial [Zetaproteobacteria bacterium CG_4_8_14_3_um_filter_59_5]